MLQSLSSVPLHTVFSYHVCLNFFRHFKICEIVFSLYFYSTVCSNKDLKQVLCLVAPSRCSSAFFNEERTALRQKRQKMRLLQQGKMFDVSNCKDLPDEIPLRLNIGTKVTGTMTEMKAHHCQELQLPDSPG